MSEEMIKQHNMNNYVRFFNHFCWRKMLSTATTAVAR